MSLANVLAVSQAARSVVLLGDPQQLEQPMQGSHPEGTDVSALHHLLDGEQTIRADRGLFLEETWRLHPDICAFTSELFYEGRLQPRPGLEAQAIRSQVPLLRQRASLLSPSRPKAIRAVRPRRPIASATSSTKSSTCDTTWIDKDNVEQPDRAVRHPDHRAVQRAGVRAAGAHLRARAIGTVDKFQGQEAPIVIYSMTTSSYADAPRGMEFLYSLNRLNVATSRAKCLCILVASPSVFEAQCRTPRQMQLANAFCRYLELATEV